MPETDPPAAAPDSARFLTADDILGAAPVLLAVFVPEWKGTVYLREIPADEGTELAEAVKAAGNTGQKARMLLLSATIADSKGQRMFTTPEQIESLGKRSLKVLARLEQEALRLNYDGAGAKNA